MEAVRWDGRAFFPPNNRVRQYALTMKPSFVGSCCVTLYRWEALRPLLRAVMLRWEGGIMFSPAWRRVARMYHGVEFGMYSYSPGLKPGHLPPGTVIGRFCSIASNVKILRRNHPVSHVSQHPIFFLRRLGMVTEDLLPGIESNPLEVGNDVWIGAGVIILPKCRKIGNGAIIAAGSVVTKDVPAFTVVAGNPAQPIRKRFAPDVERAVAASEWWLEPLDKLAQHVELFTQPLDGQRLQQFCHAFPPRTIGSS